MKNKKILLVLSSILSLGALASCSSCNCDKNKTDDDSKKDDTDDTKKEDPIYGDIKTYTGYIDTNLPISLIDGMEPISVSLLTTNVTFSYQSATNASKTDFYKSFKFHINLDLYSDENNFTSSIITQKLLPSLFSDFKYTKIQDNISDFDIYYLGDGMLYASLSSFAGEKPSRNNAIAIKNASREMINVSRIDIKAIINEIGDKINNEDYKNFDFKGTFESIFKVLNGITIDIELMNKIFTSSTLTFLSDGFNYKLKEDGVTNLSYFVNDIIVDLINNSSLGITLSEGTTLLPLDSFVFEATTSSIKFNIGVKDKASPLINLNLIGSEDNESSIDPSNNLEEEYLYSKSIVEKVDNLYLGYTNYQISDDYKVTFQKLIDEVTSLSYSDFKKVSNFNSCNGYELLEVKENGNYGYLKDYNDILNDVNTLKDAFNSTPTSNKALLKNIETYFNLYNGNNHYSDYLKDNIESKAKEGIESNYTKFISNIETFFNDKINEVEKEINELKDNYLKITSPSLNDTHSFISSLFKVLVNDQVVINEDTKITSSSDMNETDSIKYLSYSLYKNFKESSTFQKENKSDLSEPFKDIFSSYLINISKSLKNIDTDLTYITTLSDLLMFNENDNLESLMDLLDLLSETSYKSSIKSEYHSLISNVILSADKKANASIDKIILEENIYKLNRKEKITAKLDELEKTYAYYDDLFIKNNKLLSKYSSSLTYINKYNTLKNLLNEELKYFED